MRNAIRSRRLEPSVAFAKLDLYLLHPDEPKSRCFLALGFTLHDPIALARALERHHSTGTKTHRRSTPYGDVYEIVGPLVRPDGHGAAFVTVWIAKGGAEAPKLITSYPA